MAFSLPATVQELIDAVLDRTPIGFSTRAEFLTWLADNTPTVGEVVTANGVSYEYDGTTTAISDLSGWKPHGFAASPQHFGETGTADDADVFTSWLAYLYTAKVDGWIPAGIYNISYVRDRAVTGNVSITCSEDAKIYGTLTKEDFSGDGRPGSPTRRLPRRSGPWRCRAAVPRRERARRVSRL